MEYEFAHTNLAMYTATKEEKYLNLAQQIANKLKLTYSNNSYRHLLSAKIKLTNNNFNGALKELNIALNFNDQDQNDEIINQKILLNLGLVHYLLKDWAKAKEYFHKHLQSPKHSNYTYVYLAYIAYEEDDIDEFLDQYYNVHKYPYSEHYDDSEERKILDNCYRDFINADPPEWTRKAK